MKEVVASLDLIQLDTNTFNVIARGGCLFNGHGGLAGLKMETLIKYSNLARCNVYFDDQGNIKLLCDMISSTGYSNYCCLNFDQFVHTNHYHALIR